MIAEQAHSVGAVMVVDASQAVPQMPVDMTTLGADLVPSPVTRCAVRRVSAFSGDAMISSLSYRPSSEAAR